MYYKEDDQFVEMTWSFSLRQNTNYKNLLKRVFKDLKIIINEEYYMEQSDEENDDREVMKYQTNAPKENC